MVILYSQFQKASWKNLVAAYNLRKMSVCALRDWAKLMGVLSDLGSLKGENGTRTFQKKKTKLFPHYPGNENKHISIPQLVPRLPVQRDGETGAS